MQHPGQKINSSSLSVAFSNARKTLRIAKGKKKSAKRRKPSAGGRANATVDMGVLQAARKYVAEVRDVDGAMEAVRPVSASLQDQHPKNCRVAASFNASVRGTCGTVWPPRRRLKRGSPRFAVPTEEAHDTELASSRQSSAGSLPHKQRLA